jgi:hypothetical protein
MRRIVIDLPDLTIRRASFGDLFKLWDQLKQLQLDGWDFFQDQMYDIGNVRVTMLHK